MAAKAGRAAARLGELVVELGLPGPWDVLFMFLDAFSSIAEAKAKLKAHAYAIGFSEGLAAWVSGTSRIDTIYKLKYRVADPSMGERVAGFEGVRERGHNEGVDAGFKFGRAVRLRSARRGGLTSPDRSAPRRLMAPGPVPDPGTRTRRRTASGRKACPEHAGHRRQ